MKAKVQLTVGIVSLIALLVYTLAHTGALLSRYVTPGYIGYICALGIEMSIVSLSLRIGDLRKSQQSTAFFLFVLVSVVVVSAIANVSEGFYTMYQEQLTLSNVRQLDFVQSLIGVTSTGLISLIVLALAEILGTDVTATIKLVEKERNKKVSHTEESSQNVTDSETMGIAREAKMLQDAATKAERHDAIVTALSLNPETDVTELATKLGVVRQTVYRDLSELQQVGKVHKNGDGWRVTS